MNPTDQPLADPQVVLQEEFDDWAMLFHPLTGEAVGIGPVGVAIWKLLDGRRSLTEVADQVASQCDDVPSTILTDTLAFVNDLERRLFVLTEPLTRPSPSPAPPVPPSPPLPTSDEGLGLTLADGTRLALCAGDETAARVVPFLAWAARLSLAPIPFPPDTRRLLVVTDVGQIANLPYADAVCVLEPPDVPHSRPNVTAGGLRFISEPPTEEQWFWRQLVRLSACIARETHPRGGVLLHSGLAAHPHPWPLSLVQEQATYAGIQLLF